MGAENQHGAFGDFLDGLDKNGAPPPQLIHYVTVVNDLVVDKNWPPVGFQRQFHNVNRADHAGAETARAHSDERLGAVVRALNVCKAQITLHKPVYFT